MRHYAKLLRATLTVSLMLMAVMGIAVSGPPEASSEAPKQATTAEAMRFTQQYNGGNCGSCSWVLAEGVIEAGTTEKFKAFIAKESPPRNIRFDSPGGSVSEALKLGQFLRASVARSDRRA